MAGINANFNRGFNVGGLNQTGNTRNTQQAKNDVQQELKLNLNQVDGFARSNNAEQTKEEDKPKFSQGGDGEKKSFGHFYNKRMGDRTGDGEDLIKRCEADPEGTGAAVPVAALLALWDWLTQ